MTDMSDRLARSISGKGKREDVITHLLPLLAPTHLEAYSATWHPLGFLVVRLGEVPSGQLRLHIWTSNSRPIQLPNWPVHTHIFELQSHILVGTVTNEWYEVKPGNPGYSRLYEVAYRGTTSMMNATSNYVDCACTLQESFDPGSNYVVDREQYHATEVADGRFAATIVLAANPVDAVPIVVGSREGAVT